MRENTQKGKFVRFDGQGKDGDYTGCFSADIRLVVDWQGGFKQDYFQLNKFVGHKGSYVELHPQNLLENREELHKKLDELIGYKEVTPNKEK